ncbi:MAG: hypothetical protein RR848_08395 [Oscillospiraceae bacterium]
MKRQTTMPSDYETVSDYQPQNGTGRNKQTQQNKAAYLLSVGGFSFGRQAWRRATLGGRALRSCRFAQSPSDAGQPLGYCCLVHGGTYQLCISALRNIKCNLGLQYSPHARKGTLYAFIPFNVQSAY